MSFCGWFSGERYRDNFENGKNFFFKEWRKVYEDY